MWLLGGASGRTLTRRLRELEDCGIIDRYVHQHTALKVENPLTTFGRGVEPVLHAMRAWAERR